MKLRGFVANDWENWRGRVHYDWMIRFVDFFIIKILNVPPPHKKIFEVRLVLFNICFGLDVMCGRNGD